MSAVGQLFYVSEATRPFDEGAVAMILRQARRNNPARDITGCLLYSGLSFAQVLEGRTEVLDDMARRLTDDPRHTNVKILARTLSATRSYAEWSMGYMHSLDMQDALQRLLVEAVADDQLVESTLRSIRPDPVTGFV